MVCFYSFKTCSQVQPVITGETSIQIKKKTAKVFFSFVLMSWRSSARWLQQKIMRDG